MLTSPQSDLWDAYVSAENRWLRHESSVALNRFLDAFSTLPAESQREWAFELAAKIVENGESIRVRMPLFQRVLLPSLRFGIAVRRLGAARYLAHFAPFILGCPDLRDKVADGSLTERGLLLTALDHDPADDAARSKLVDLIASQLKYSIHELPSGVLFGSDGATISQCQELLADLDNFCVHTEHLGIAGEFDDLISKCRYHFAMYASYLADRQGASCYAEYFKNHEDSSDSEH